VAAHAGGDCSKYQIEHFCFDMDEAGSKHLLSAKAGVVQGTKKGSETSFQYLEHMLVFAAGGLVGVAAALLLMQPGFFTSRNVDETKRDRSDPASSRADKRQIGYQGGQSLSEPRRRSRNSKANLSLSDGMSDDILSEV
jgi:hypothetical protein